MDPPVSVKTGVLAITIRGCCTIEFRHDHCVGPHFGVQPVQICKAVKELGPAAIPERSPVCHVRASVRVRA